MNTIASHLPLSAQLRPRTLDEFVGQSHLLAPNQPLYNAIKAGRLHSLVFWGPPGTGKTTLAHLIAHYADAEFVPLSAVVSGVKEVRSVAEAAEKILPRRTILFLDEIHRFNKAQQDALLPFVEQGIIILIGATTENPSFSLNNALLSRTRIYVLKRLEIMELTMLIRRALTLDAAPNVIEILAQMADGDGRQCLNLCEVLIATATAEKIEKIDKNFLQQVFNDTPLRRFDKGGEYFYDLISALHKSVRGSDVNASLYWFARMIDGGCEPIYIARRVIRMASEDIGLADPKALTLALDALRAYEYLGSPEGELAIAEAITYLAAAPKSNRIYTAYAAALKAAQTEGTLEVPLHLRNSPTALMRKLGYGKHYRYAHDEPYAYAANETYLPEDLKQRQFYDPSERGMEKKIQEKLIFLRQLDKKALLIVKNYT